MGGGRTPGALGTDAPPFEELGGGDADVLPGAGSTLPGPIGVDPAIPMTGERIITVVTRDWVPPNPRTTPAITIGGRTLAEAAQALNRLNEWGEGGGMLRTDRVPVGTSATVTVVAHANLVRRLPTWTGYANASTAAKAEWDRMMVHLTAHEQRHVDIAIEEANALADALIGHEIADIANMVTSANQTMNNRQVEMDNDTNHGANTGVPYGDVTLDTTIT